MANTKSALKQLRKSVQRHERNKSIKTEIKTAEKRFNILMDENKLDEAKVYLKKLVIKLNKAASKNIIHKNKANRKKSRLMKKLDKPASQGTQSNN
jgi:small subunit ribosomal protein S20